MKYLILLVGLLMLTGCEELSEFAKDLEHHHYVEETGPSINEYFQQDIKTYKERSISLKYDCIEGTCPAESKINDKEKSFPCFFCNNTEVIGNTLQTHIGMSGYMDAFAGCVDKGNPVYPDKLEIIEKTPTKIVAKGAHTGRQEHVGDCSDGEYKYNYVREVIWTFERNN